MKLKEIFKNVHSRKEIYETFKKDLKEIYETFKKDSSTVDNHFESDLSSYEIFLRASIFETKWFSTAPFFFSV